MSYRLLKLKKPKLFKPSYKRGDQSLSLSTNPNNIAINDTVGNSESTASFRYESNKSLKSTQQLNIDYSYFENHTFFNSALSKTNISFDKIINKYPFEGSQKEVEDFEDNLTGFENYVLDNYPKHTGSLVLSGTAINEDPANGYAAGLGQYIIVKDGKGLEFPNFSKDSTAIADLDPSDKSFTFEFFIKLPSQTNSNQIICQKMSSLSNNITLALEASSNTTSAGLKFGVTNGTEFLFLSSSIDKGEFKHVAVQFDNEGGFTEQQKLKYYLDGELALTSSTQFQLSDIDLGKADFTIGSGSQVRINEQLFTPQQTLSGSIDEFRFFHSARQQDTIKKQRFQNIYATSDLKAYYRFNETQETHNLNNIVLDQSGNSRHAKITNYTTDCRSSFSPVQSENLKRNPVLFFVQTVADLNTKLVNSASFYDEFNPNLITKLVPPHLFLEGEAFEGLDQNNPLSNLELTPTQSGMPGSGKFGSSQLLISFLLIWAKFFDELKLFVDSFGDVRDVNYDTEDTTPDVFLKALATHYNIELPDFFPNADLNQLTAGEGIYSVGSQRSKHTLEYIQNQLWRRILTNAVHLQKSTGTIEGMRSSLRAMGVNVDDIFTIREYGGQSRITLDGIRVDKTDNIRTLPFTGSLGSSTTVIPAAGDSLLVKLDALANNNAALYPAAGADTASLIPSEGRGFTFSWWQRQNTPDGVGSLIDFLAVRDSSGRSIIKMQKRGNVGNGELRATFSNHTGISQTQQVFWNDFGQTYLIDGVGNWYQFTITWNGETSNLKDNLFLYVNGIKINYTNDNPGTNTDISSTTGGSLMYFGPNRNVGGTNDDLNDANIASIAWWNQALTPAQVLELYNNGQMFNVATQHSVPVDGYWQTNSANITLNGNTSTEITATVGPNLHNDFKGTGAYSVSSAIPFTAGTVTTGVFTRLQSGYLSGSRIELGRPDIKGTFVDKVNHFPHGISNNKDDGLFTSGSFTFEGVYRFPTLKSGSYPEYQSLARLHVTGTAAPSDTGGILTNLVLRSGSSPTITLYSHAGQTGTVATDQLLEFDLNLSSGSIFDGNLWHISFGRKRGDLIFEDEPVASFNKTSVSSSYFLRAARVGQKRLLDVYTGSNTHAEDDGVTLQYFENAFQETSTLNTSGSFIVIGPQTIDTHRFYFLNKSAFNDVVRTTSFAGELGPVRFWSKAVTDREFREHVRNIKSLGVADPTVNYNFMTHNTGTFEQVRVWTDTKQGTTSSDNLGNFRLFDFSQNEKHFSGSGFEVGKTLFNASQLRYSTLNPQFDVAGTTDKVRIRSLQNFDPIKKISYPYASGAPVYNVPENEEVIDDLRFSLEMSLVKALNEDIVNMFSDYQFIENAIGRTNLLFSEKYPELDQVRKNYFENTTGKLDVDKYYKLFKWFNDTFSSTIEQMLPSKTKFMGINFVVESHALERHKFKYYYDEIYLKALQRDPSRGVILLSQFVGTLKKF